MPPERIETLLSAIFFVLSLIAAKEGIKPDVIEKYAGDVYSTRPRKFKPLTQEEQEEREDNDVRNSFASSLMKIKYQIARAKMRGDNNG